MRAKFSMYSVVLAKSNVQRRNGRQWPFRPLGLAGVAKSKQSFSKNFPPKLGYSDGAQFPVFIESVAGKNFLKAERRRREEEKSGASTHLVFVKFLRQLPTCSCTLSSL